MPFLTARFGNPLLTDWPQMLSGLRNPAGFDSLAEIDRAYACVQQQVSEATTICNDLLDRLAGQASGMPGHASGGKSRYDMSFNLLFEANQFADLLSSKVWSSADPKAVHDTWVLLTKDMQAELLLADPLRFGNLNGIPAADRDTANQAMLTARLDRLKVGLEAAGIAPTTDPKDLDGLDPTQFAIVEALSGLTLREARQTLLLKRQLRRNGEAGVQLLAYEPGAYGGKGRAAIAYGDLDHADNIAFCIPGLMTSVDNVNNVASDAQALYNQAIQADPGRHTAVVAWQGYDAPNFGNVAFQGAAERGARLLAADVKAMRTTHDGPIATLTAVGHSYGSTTTGLALQREHLDVDQVALIGSPGVGGDAKTAADLHLDRSRVFVGSASEDVVTTITDSLGEDPSEDTFGATRFKAESVNRNWHSNFADHSRYYDTDRGESLFALADIVTGHGDRLGHDGMLAAGRHTEMTGIGYEGSEVVVDPEATRTPTAGHDHANDVGRTH